jgi:hypothetical protein
MKVGAFIIAFLPVCLPACLFVSVPAAVCCSHLPPVGWSFLLALSQVKLRINT